HASGAAPLVDGERYPGRSAAPSRAGAAPLRNAAVLGATDRTARVPRAGVAGAGYVSSRVSSDEGDAQAPPVVDPCRRLLVSYQPSLITLPGKQRAWDRVLCDACPERAATL